MLLAACAVGPQYSRPALDVPEVFRDETGARGTASLADLSWWDIYRDPTLRELLKTAVEQNRDIKIAAARVTEARAQAAEVLRLDPEFRLSNVKLFYRNPADAEVSFEGMRKAGLPE